MIAIKLHCFAVLTKCMCLGSSVSYNGLGILPAAADFSVKPIMNALLYFFFFFFKIHKRKTIHFRSATPENRCDYLSSPSLVVKRNRSQSVPVSSSRPGLVINAKKPFVLLFLSVTHAYLLSLPKLI